MKMEQTWGEYWSEIKDEIWESAMTEAHEKMGYYKGEYVDDWDELVWYAKKIHREYKEIEYSDWQLNLCNDAHDKHKEYLQSKMWNKIRFEVLERDKFRCVECGKSAEDVHHVDYKYLGTDMESDYCVSLCKTCHKEKHKDGGAWAKCTKCQTQMVVSKDRKSCWCVNPSCRDGRDNIKLEA